MYGFMQEVTQKYDKEIYDAFNEVFAVLPIATVANGAVLVLHGGVDSKVTMESLRAAPRSQYVVNATNAGQKPGLVHPAMREKMAAIRKQQEVRARTCNAPLRESRYRRLPW